jgi:hypothetical protein
MGKGGGLVGRRRHGSAYPVQRAKTERSPLTLVVARAQARAAEGAAWLRQRCLRYLVVSRGVYGELLSGMGNRLDLPRTRVLLPKVLPVAQTMHPKSGCPLGFG